MTHKNKTDLNQFKKLDEHSLYEVVVSFNKNNPEHRAYLFTTFKSHFWNWELYSTNYEETTRLREAHHLRVIRKLSVGRSSAVSPIYGIKPLDWVENDNVHTSTAGFGILYNVTKCGNGYELLVMENDVSTMLDTCCSLISARYRAMQDWKTRLSTVLERL